MTSERIEKIIYLKNFTKEQLEAEARQKREELMVEKDKLKRLERLLGETMRRFVENQETGLLNTEEIILFHDYIAHVESQVKQQKKIVQKKREILMEKEKELINAYREKRLLEILHDSTIKEEIREAIVKEQKEMDLDFIMRRFRRQDGPD